jgi:type IV secretory pathway VirB9-like protein
MSDRDKSYYARRAAEEAELAQQAADPTAQAVHRRLQRAYIERASVGDRTHEPSEQVG